MIKHFFVTILFAGASMPEARAATDAKPFRYVITETGKFSSLDPLDADATSNLPVARMIYATPLETSPANQLASRVLESFRYDPKARTVEWNVKPGLKFEDGTDLTAEDVAFAVTRMAFTRPKFPVLSSIVGVTAWASLKDALKSKPEGIRVDRNKITIRFSSPVDHPLFRFCLELFSIIPRRCVDISTNKINCASVPESGPYKIAAQDEASATFVRRASADSNLPTTIAFTYVGPNHIAEQLQKLDDHTVIAGAESDYSPGALKALENASNLEFLPAARFEAVLINKDVEPFNHKKCRQTFARAFRKSFHTIGKQRLLEGSLFTKILPGYEPLQKLEFAATGSDSEQCLEKFAKAQIPWAYEESDIGSLFVQAVEQTLYQLGVKNSKPKVMKTRKEFADSYSDAKIAFFNAGSGFWALDPAGDVQMLFTPNLHRPLNQITSDGKLQKLLGGLNSQSESFRAVNRYLFDEALINVYSHQRRFFATPKNVGAQSPNFAITSPAPWQLFKVVR